MISEILYTLFIWPINFILEFLFVLFIRIFRSPGFAVVFLSVVVSTLTLPLYLIADRWQKEERNLQKKMKAKLDKIRSVFKGDERQMIINAYYRQMGYSGVIMLKASAGLLLQIPFFIAAYQFLSRTAVLSGVSFFFIPDLSVQDALVKLPFSVFGLTALNIMPFIMTALNIFSALIYAKDLGKREHIQLYVMSLVFLVLLYRSPAGLVLYWTMNNVYSLIKNTAIRYVKNPQIAVKITAAGFSFIFLLLIWTGKANVDRYKFMFSAIALLGVGIPLFWNRIAGIFESKKNKSVQDVEPQTNINALYISSFLLLFLLVGLLNPAQVLSASLADFEEPWTFMGRTFLQGLSFLFLVPMFIRSFAPYKIRRFIAMGAAAAVLNAVASYFVLFTSYGIMDRNFKLDDTNRLIYAYPLWISVIVPLFAIALVYIVFRIKKEKMLTFVFQISCAAILALSVFNLASIQRQAKQLNVIDMAGTANTASVFTLSGTEQNIFIISLDRAQGSALSDALLYMPSLKQELDGFVFYPNTISFGNCTVTGVPAMLGGYDYTPEKINKRKDELLVDKVNSAITRMPRIFGEAGYRVTITGPVIANLNSVADTSIFRGMKNVKAQLLSGKMTDRFRSEFPSEDDKGAASFNFDILFRYGVFRVSSPALRYGIYYKGQWWREAAYNSYGRAIGEFSSLYYLPDICSVDSGDPALNILLNFITHEGGNYNRDFFPQQERIEFTDEELSLFGSRENAEYMFVLISAFKQLSAWFDFLKSKNVYDNTRLIIVSDHGGRYTQGMEMEGFNPVLLVKDFNNRGELKILNDFMTHSDIQYIAGDGLDGIGISYADALIAKEGEIAVFSAVSSQPLRHGPYQFNLSQKRELKEKDVLSSESWADWEAY